MYNTLSTLEDEWYKNVNERIRMSEFFRQKNGGDGKLGGNVPHLVSICNLPWPACSLKDTQGNEGLRGEKERRETILKIPVKS